MSQQPSNPGGSGRMSRAPIANAFTGTTYNLGVTNGYQVGTNTVAPNIVATVPAHTSPVNPNEETRKQ